MIGKALVLWLDAGRRVLRTREIEFTSRADLLWRVERDLDHCWAIEAWNGGDCLLCLNAHGAVGWRCCPPQPAGCG